MRKKRGKSNRGSRVLAARSKQRFGSQPASENLKTHKNILGRGLPLLRNRRLRMGDVGRGSL